MVQTIQHAYGPRLSNALGNRLAEDLLRYAPAGGVMLHYGGGEALFADRVAEPTARLILCEAAAEVRAMLAGRLAGNAKIFVRKPEDIAAMTPQSVDVIVLHSVARHQSTQEFDSLIRQFRRLLRNGGLLALADVAPRRLSAFSDATELLQFGAQSGCYWAAVSSIFRASVSGYRSAQLGPVRSDEDELIARLESLGFSAQRARTNIGHNGRRMTFLAHAR